MDSLLPTLGATQTSSGGVRATGGLASNGARYRLITQDNLDGTGFSGPVDSVTLLVDKSTDGGISWIELPGTVSLADFPTPGFGDDTVNAWLDYGCSFFKDDIIGVALILSCSQHSNGFYDLYLPQYAYFDCLSEAWTITSLPPANTFDYVFYSPGPQTISYFGLGDSSLSIAIAPGAVRGDCTIAVCEGTASSDFPPGPPWWIRCTYIQYSSGSWSGPTVLPTTDANTFSTGTWFHPFQGLLQQNGDISFALWGQDAVTGIIPIYYSDALVAPTLAVNAPSGYFSILSDGNGIAATISGVNSIIIPLGTVDSLGNNGVEIAIADEATLTWNVYPLDTFTLVSTPPYFQYNIEVAPTSPVCTGGTLAVFWVRPLASGGSPYGTTVAAIMAATFTGTGFGAATVFRNLAPDSAAVALATVSTVVSGVRTVVTLTPHGFTMGEGILFENLPTMGTLWGAPGQMVGTILSPTSFTFTDTSGEPSGSSSSSGGTVQSTTPSSTLVYLNVEAESLTSALLLRVDTATASYDPAVTPASFRHVFCTGFPIPGGTSYIAGKGNWILG